MKTDAPPRLTVVVTFTADRAPSVQSPPKRKGIQPRCNVPDAVATGIKLAVEVTAEDMKFASGLNIQALAESATPIDTRLVPGLTDATPVSERYTGLPTVNPEPEYTTDPG
jgi:hypothetical protein